jgi:hypothetical protein
MEGWKEGETGLGSNRLELQCVCVDALHGAIKQNTNIAHVRRLREKRQKEENTREHAHVVSVYLCV